MNVKEIFFDFGSPLLLRSNSMQRIRPASLRQSSVLISGKKFDSSTSTYFPSRFLLQRRLLQPSSSLQNSRDLPLLWVATWDLSLSLSLNIHQIWTPNLSSDLSGRNQNPISLFLLKTSLRLDLLLCKTWDPIPVSFIFLLPVEKEGWSVKRAETWETWNIFFFSPEESWSFHFSFMKWKWMGLKWSID